MSRPSDRPTSPDELARGQRARMVRRDSGERRFAEALRQAREADERTITLG